MTTKNKLKIRDMIIQFLVEDIDRSIEFYTKLLGFEISFCYEDFYSGITKDGYSIHLKLGKPSREERENRENNQHLDIIFSIDNIEDLHTDMKHKPIKIIQPLREMPYGIEFYIADPDGYIIGFLQEK